MLASQQRAAVSYLSLPSSAADAGNVTSKLPNTGRAVRAWRDGNWRSGINYFLAQVADKRRLPGRAGSSVMSSDVVSMSVRQLRAVVVVLLAALNLFQPPPSTLRCWLSSSTSTVVGAAAGSVGARMSPRVIQTQYGKLRGVLDAVPVSIPADAADAPDVPGGGLVESYLGLQYGTLLDGELRFMPPTGTLEKWDGVRVALRHRPVCPQPAVQSVDKLRSEGLPLARAEHLRRLAPHLERQAEECLNLNVYVPVTGKPIDTEIGGIFQQINSNFSSSAAE